MKYYIEDTDNNGNKIHKEVTKKFAKKYHSAKNAVEKAQKKILETSAKEEFLYYDKNPKLKKQENNLENALANFRTYALEHINKKNEIINKTKPPKKILKTDATTIIDAKFFEPMNQSEMENSSMNLEEIHAEENQQLFDLLDEPISLQSSGEPTEEYRSRENSVTNNESQLTEGYPDNFDKYLSGIINSNTQDANTQDANTQEAITQKTNSQDTNSLVDPNSQELDNAPQKGIEPPGNDYKTSTSVFIDNYYSEEESIAESEKEVQLGDLTKEEYLKLVHKQRYKEYKASKAESPQQKTNPFLSKKRKSTIT